jgi:hypothetical protein
MNREVHVRIWERPEVRVLWATRQSTRGGLGLFIPLRPSLKDGRGAGFPHSAPLHLWQRLYMAMHELPHGLPLTQCGISEKERAGLRPLDADARRDLYEILEERYRRRSTILSSQIPVDK